MNFSKLSREILALLVFLLGFTEPNYREKTIEELATMHMKELFIDWAEKYHKIYETDTEFNLRFKIWQESYLKVQRHNLQFALKKTSYTMGMNQFSDLTGEEFAASRSIRGYSNHLSKNFAGAKSMYPEVSQSREVPVNRDWRDRSVVLPVRQQGPDCGSCWAHAAAGVVETQLGFAGALQVVSVQQAMDCTAGDGCGGLVHDYAFKAWQENYIASEAEYPYQEFDTGNCRNGRTGFHVNHYWAIEDEVRLEEFVGKYGPCAAGVDSKLWQDYQGGIYNGNCGTALDHEVLIIGYTVDYWIIKNSWGTTWGDNGYMYLPKWRNYCGIAKKGGFATVARPSFPFLPPKMSKN